MGFLNSVFGWLKGFFDLVASTVLGKAAESISKAAVEVVESLEGEDMNGKEKWEEAQRVLKEMYPSVEIAAINLAIESAVAIVKDKLED